jgi:hypothetical protein
MEPAHLTGRLNTYIRESWDKTHLDNEMTPVLEQRLKVTVPYWDAKSCDSELPFVLLAAEKSCTLEI